VYGAVGSSVYMITKGNASIESKHKQDDKRNGDNHFARHHGCSIEVQLVINHHMIAPHVVVESAPKQVGSASHNPREIPKSLPDSADKESKGNIFPKKLLAEKIIENMPNAGNHDSGAMAEAIPAVRRVDGRKSSRRHGCVFLDRMGKK